MRHPVADNVGGKNQGWSHPKAQRSRGSVDFHHDRGHHPRRMNWIRVLIGGFLAEVLVIVLIAPVVLVAGLDTLDDPANLPASVGYGIVLASFIAPLVMTQWVVKRATSQFVLHGLLVGFTAFVVYMIPTT